MELPRDKVGVFLADPQGVVTHSHGTHNDTETFMLGETRALANIAKLLVRKKSGRRRLSRKRGVTARSRSEPV